MRGGLASLSESSESSESKFSAAGSSDGNGGTEALKCVDCCGAGGVEAVIFDHTHRLTGSVTNAAAEMRSNPMRKVVFLS